MREEVELVRDLVGSLTHVLDDPDPDDAAVARLFPRAVGDDDEADAELRRLIHDDLVGVKRAGLEALRALLDGGTWRGRELRVALEPDDALLVLGVCNDLRLAIAARVGFAKIEARELDPDDPDVYRLAVIDHLGLWQELLLELLDPPAVRRDTGLDPDDAAGP